MACLYDQARVVSELLKKLKSEPNAVNIQDNVSIILDILYNVNVESYRKLNFRVDTFS